MKNKTQSCFKQLYFRVAYYAALKKLIYGACRFEEFGELEIQPRIF